MKKIALFCALFFWVKTISAQQRLTFQQIGQQFVDSVKAFELPPLQLAYTENLKAISNQSAIERQTSFFKNVSKQLSHVKIEELGKKELIDYKLMQYETNLNLERLALEKKWVANKPDSITKNGLNQLKNGKEWYAYFLKKWVASAITPEQIYKLGLAEIDRVNNQIEVIRLKTGYSDEQFYNYLNDSSFFVNDETTIAKLFDHAKTTIQGNLSTIFNQQSIPDLKIERGKNNALVQAPGYYDENTFYFNFYDKPYCKRQIDWLFIHEGIPGHHYQISIEGALKESAIQQLFWYPGYSEGWAAYTEELGKELGVYKTIYDELGKWEWDIVRSVRVPLDVGINYYGWSDEQALAFWKKYIKNQDAIAMREINRIKRWPAQVVTYKYGAGEILQWKQLLQRKEGVNFDIRNFHDKILNNGSLPFSLLESLLNLSE
ncbi:hypothetical protein D3C80_186360 [compost metagenome]